MTRLRYGNYLHDAGECEVRRTISPRLADTQAVVGYTERWDIAGEIIASTPEAIAAQLAEMDAAYALQNQTLTLETDAGFVLMRLSPVGSVVGVRVAPASLPDGTGAEWATGLKYTLIAEAEYTGNSEAAIVAFQETLQFSGGGPLYVWRQPLEGNPIKQRVAQRTPYVLVQSGSSTGRYGYLTAPGPLFPEHLWHGPAFTLIGPVTRGGQLLDYTTNWTYTMQSVSPFQGQPTLPPI